MGGVRMGPEVSTRLGAVEGTRSLLRVLLSSSDYAVGGGRTGGSHETRGEGGWGV